ncbi:MAG: MBL fold metallo-hydrolase [Azoarcus sp.]|jgi:glyoxylase-like metal-dependent hydrolase (beta-lactamase superfamily II)|nr:MBL fold metallo-hydrolase [Azoarcus sp.]
MNKTETYRIVPVTPFQQNCTLLWCGKTRKAVVIDPGGEIKRIRAAIGELNLSVERILLTHGHIDHVGGAAALSAALAAPIEGPHREDGFLIEGASLARQCGMFGWPPVESFTPTRWLDDGDEIRFGDETLRVIHAPGHTPGHIVYFHAGAKLAQVGDVLFAGSIGRTDFPRGDHPTLIRSIRARLFPLGDDVRFIPGHGPESTFGRERASNPYVGDGADV